MQLGLLSSLGLLGGGGPIPGMAAWFRKGRGITDVAGAVSAWADQSGNGRDLVQATGAAQPALQGDGTILFNGSSHFLKTAAFTLNQPCTVYLRFKQVAWTISRRIFDGNASNSMVLMEHDGSGPAPVGTPNLLMFAGAYAPAAASIQTIAVNTWASASFVYNGASSLEQDGANPAVTGNPGAGNAGGFTLGANGAGANFSNIQVAEATIYSAAHDTSQRARMLAYLNRL